MPDRPHILLICVDQWRGDCLGIDGHPAVQTPFLDQLAATGTRFGRAYTATPSCIAARAGLYTGLSPRAHGRVGYQDGVPWDYPVTFAGEFTRHGYQTQAIGKLHVFPERSQIGFQNVLLHDGYLHFARERARDIGRTDDYIPWLREQTGDPHADHFDHGVNCNGYVARPWDKDERLHPTTWCVSQAIEFLRRRDLRKPFFLFLSFHRPHPPLDPPAWAFDLYRDLPMPDPPVGDWVDELVLPYESVPAGPVHRIARLPAHRLRRARQGYYGHMSHIDHQLGRLWEVLHEFRVRPDTLIGFVSDHGDLLGDHHLYGKSEPYEGSARVPLFFAGPGVDARRRVGPEGLCELRDVMPTLLEMAGLPTPETVEGKSLAPFLRGESPSGWREFLHGEHTSWSFGRSQATHYLTDGRVKYVWWSGSGREQLFDLETDPDECRDLAPGGDPRVPLYRQRLVAELTDRPEEFVDPSGDLVPDRPVRAVLPHLRPSD